MKLLILSDLHLELGGAYAAPADLDFDVVVSPVTSIATAARLSTGR